MQTLPTVIVRPGEADRILAGHPWIYHGSILQLTTEVEDGAVVQIKDHRQRFLGLGFYNSKSKIRVRWLSRERLEIDRNFFRQRIVQALELRKKYLPKATSFRVVNAESDFLSGLIVDKYEDVLVVQTSSLGMDQRKGLIVEVLREVLSPKTIFERNEMASRKFEGLEPIQGLLFGEPIGANEIQLNGLRFNINLMEGHKTGYYLDQQLNYELVSSYARDGANVLDCFCFIGGFSLHAARAGAESVLGLDQSAEAIQAAEKNAASNHLESRCQFQAQNVFDWLKEQTAAAPNEKVIPRYDLIILDPPSFTKNRASIDDAMRGYKEIHLRAFKLLKSSGTLATFCCSHHITANLFQEVILAAAFDARRVLRRVATFTQSPDHPVIPAIPETEYLKGFAFELAL